MKQSRAAHDRCREFANRSFDAAAPAVVGDCIGVEKDDCVRLRLLPTSVPCTAGVKRLLQADDAGARRLRE